MSLDNVNLELLKAELIRDEGIRLKPYQDSLGYWTIGVGHLLSGPSVEEWSLQKCLDVLESDIQLCLDDIAHEQWFLSLQLETQRRGLCNMRFQLGSKGLRTFKNSLRLLEQREYTKAGKELRQSTWYKQTPNRAERVIRMIENGS